MTSDLFFASLTILLTPAAHPSCGNKNRPGRYEQKESGSNNNIKHPSYQCVTSLPSTDPQALQSHLIKNREIAVRDLGFYLQADGMATVWFVLLENVTWLKAPAPAKKKEAQKLQASSRLTLLAPVREAKRISAPPACSSLRRV